MPRLARLFLTALLLPVAATAQEAPPNPCEHPGTHEFDFWVGEWDLTWADGGTGVNRITRELDSCVVVERFDGRPSTPLVGMSVSTYRPADGVWRQTWVDNSGAYLDFEGGFADGKMILSRETVRNGETVKQRMVWHNIAEDSFDWNWEMSKDGGETWNVAWAIRYERK